MWRRCSGVPGWMRGWNKITGGCDKPGSEEPVPEPPVRATSTIPTNCNLEANCIRRPAWTQIHELTGSRICVKSTDYTLGLEKIALLSCLPDAALPARLEQRQIVLLLVRVLADFFNV